MDGLRQQRNKSLLAVTGYNVTAGFCSVAARIQARPV